MPKISVITPAFNAALDIGRTIASVQAQTYTDWEHIIIDDGSTDETRAVVDACRDNRLSYRYQSNQGPGEARNHGVQFSNGEYLIFLDADDWWTPNCLELLAAKLDKVPTKLAASYGDWVYVDGAGNAGRVHSDDFKAGHPLRTLLFRSPFVLHSIMITRVAWESVGGFCNNLASAEDWDVWIHLALFDCQFHHIPHLVAYYNWRPNSWSKNLHKNAVAMRKVLDRVWAHDGLPEEILDLKNVSYANALTEICVGGLAIGDTEIAFEKLDAAEKYQPRTICAVDTYYRIAYANLAAYENAPEKRSESLEINGALDRIESVLSYLQSRPDLYSLADIRCAKSAAYAAIGFAGYHETRFSLARRYLTRAIMLDLRNQLIGETGFTLVKTFIPLRFLKMARRFRSA